MDILPLMDGLSAEEIGKMVLRARDEIVREGAQRLLDALLEGEICEFFEKAGEAAEGDFRNGYYSRTVATPYGPLVLRIPRDRLGRFRTRILEPYRRSTEGIGEMIQGLYVRGMTEREISDQLLDTCGVSLSRETVRRKVREALGDALAFNSRAVPDCPVVYLDGTYVPMKRRYGDSSKVQKECVMVALGITPEGRKEVLGFYFTPNEGSWAWDDVLGDLKARGLSSPALFVTDGLQGMPEAIRRTFPGARHQLCLVHEARTICRDVRRTDRKAVAEAFREVYSAPCRKEAERRLADFLGKWGRTYPAMARKLSGKPDLLTFMDAPKPLWRSLYTSNPVEGFNAKLKRLTRKRILMNSEENAVLTVASACADYNRNAGRVTLRGFADLGEEERRMLFVEEAGTGRCSSLG